VLTGWDTASVGALAWLDAAAAAHLAAEADGGGPGGSEGPEGGGPAAGAAGLARHPRVREALAGALARLNRREGSSRRVERLLLLDEPPSLDAGEITDKGYVNQRAVLDRRAVLVAALHADPPPPEAILAPDR
jgi:feruloyl-CoA synthase